MNGMARRLNRLESGCGIDEEGSCLIIRTGVPRATDGLQDPGPVCATIVSGPNKGA